MRVVPGLIKDGEVQVFIEVQEDPDTLEIAGLEQEETDTDEDNERAAESGEEREEGHDKEDGGEEDEDEDDGDEDDDEEDDEDDSVNRLETVADAVAAVCETLYQRLQAKLDEDEAPTEFRIEFGITLAGRMGIPVVSQGDTAPAFKVTVKWENS